MDTSDFTPGELRIVRFGLVGGWVLAGLMAAGLVAGAFIAKHELRAARQREAEHIRAFIAAVRTCYRAEPGRRTWEDCEEIVKDRLDAAITKS